jgi:hypothetical protein
MGIVPASANNPNTMIAEVAQVQATTMVPVVLAECKKQMHKLGADQVPSRFGCIASAGIHQSDTLPGTVPSPTPPKLAKQLHDRRLPKALPPTLTDIMHHFVDSEPALHTAVCTSTTVPILPSPQRIRQENHRFSPCISASSMDVASPVETEPVSDR